MMNSRKAILAGICALAIAIAMATAAEAQEQTAPVFRPMGFADLSYVATDGSRSEGFLVGQVVGHLSAVLADRLNLFGEMSATARSNDFVIDVERIIVRYDFADFFKISAGRYHTPHSFWNTEYHHGLWLQTTAGRPEMIRFGSTVMPVHFVGAQIEGLVAPGTIGLGYVAGVGNGRAANVARAGDAGDINDDRAFTFALSAKPPSIPGLRVGGALHFDRVTLAGADELTKERIASAHVAWLGRGPELIAEYARITHEEDVTAANAYGTDAYYMQLAYSLPGQATGLKPYLRLERIDVPAEDPFFGPLGADYNGAIAGIRFDFAHLAALKAEYRSERFSGLDRAGTFVAQISIALSSVGMEEM
jgi:hypothetical protein